MDGADPQTILIEQSAAGNGGRRMLITYLR
jgi:hypothetical protein